MTLETFFEKFELFADAPDAVEKMRGLILQFAVTGRLSEKINGDAPVGELVHALARGKAQVAMNGRRSVEKPFTNESEIERPINAPDHWAWVSLNDIGVMSGGMTPSKAKATFWDGDVNWFSSKDIKTDELIESELKITREAAESTGLQIYPTGSLVMVARSGILKRTFPVSILRAAGTVNQDLKVLRPFVGGIERYIQIMLRGMTDFILKSLVKTGMTVQSLKYDEFEAQMFPLPPLAEQKRIVAKVDELMALCDRLKAQLQEREGQNAALARASLARFADAPTLANLEVLFHKSYSIPPADLRKSILTLAIQGDLSSGSSDPVARSEVRMKEVCDLITDGEHATPQRVASGIPLATAKNVRDGFLDMSQTDYVALETAEKCWKRCKPKDQDILMVCVGATTGRVCLVRNPPDMVLVRSVSLLRPNIQRIEPTFLDLFLRSPSGQSQIWGGVRQNAQPCLYLGKMSEFTIQLPPIAEQRRTVEKVDELMALVDALETQLATARTIAEKLMEALVAELTTLD